MGKTTKQQNVTDRTDKLAALRKARSEGRARRGLALAAAIHAVAARDAADQADIDAAVEAYLHARE